MPENDNWADRKGRMICGLCMWWSPKGNGAMGRCRRRAPTLNGYPVVFATDWCGDHKMDEGVAQ